MKERQDRRGFASMSRKKQRKISSRGGKAAHKKGTAHEWTGGPDGTASSAGRKGGRMSHGRRGRMVEQANVADSGGVYKKEI